MTMQEFAAKARAKYPGAYDSLDDLTLVHKIVAKYPVYKDQIDDMRPNNPVAEQLGDNPAAGMEKPVEQKIAENTVEVGNDASMAYGIPMLAKGLIGLGMKGVGALSKGLSGPAESGANWMGSRVLQFARSVLPKEAGKAEETIQKATDYAMNPHPEIQQAIMDMKGAGKAVAPDAEAVGANAGVGMVPKTGTQTTVKAPALAGAEERSLAKTGELEPAPKSSGEAVEGEVVNPPNYADEAAQATDEVAPELGNFDQPIISWTGNTGDMYKATQGQLSTVGKAIEDTLAGLNETGHMYDPAATAKALEGMYQRNASGAIIPAGTGSQQAMYNQAVSKALETLKANALDDNGIIQKIGWDQANGIKAALQDLASYGEKAADPVNDVYMHAAATVRDSIDDQAQRILAANGHDIAPFQTLRDAYHKLKLVENSLGNKMIGEMSAKNAAPVVRTGIGAAGLATGHPGVAAVMAADYAGRRYGPQMAARALKGLSEGGEGMAEAGANMAEGTMAPAAKAIASGLSNPEDER